MILELIFAATICTSLPITFEDDGSITGAGCSIVSVPPPVPPPPVPLPTGEAPQKIAVAGCSNTRRWVGDDPGYLGYEDYTGVNLFSKTNSFGGGSVQAWNNSGQYIQAFRANIVGNEDAILAQVCVTNQQIDYSLMQNYLLMLSTELPGVPVYVVPLGTSGATCSYANQVQSIALSQQAVANGHAQGMIPSLSPPYSTTETNDGCHPNSAGNLRMTDAINVWLATF